MEKLNLRLDGNSTIGNQEKTRPIPKTGVVQCCIKYLIHAWNCKDANCVLFSCQKMKRKIEHSRSCNRIRSNERCRICRFLFGLCSYHAKYCQEAKCSAPYCANMKKIVWQIERREIRRKLQEAVILKRSIDSCDLTLSMGRSDV